MKTLQFGLFALLCATILGIGCSKDDDDSIVVTPIKDGLVLEIQNEFRTLPAKVSVFFKVRKKDGTPVAGLRDSDFTIYEKGRNDEKMRLISIDEARRQISPKGQLFAFSTLLVLDLSGSVTNSNLPDLKDAAKAFINAVMPENNDGSVKMSIMWFDGENKLHELADFTENRTALLNAVNGITPNISTDNSTDLYGAVLKSVDAIDLVLYENDDRISAASVVIFTDGTDQAARYTQKAALDAVANADAHISFHSIGLGSEIDENTLKKIGKNSFAFAENTKKLLETFEKIAQRVSDDANSYYLFEYCSPKRDGSGMNDLKIEAIYQNQKGSVTTKFDATNFTGGCSL